MFEVEKASEVEAAARKDLADKATEALTLAGFTVHRDINNASGARGPLVWVDPTADAGGGIFVRWLIDSALSHAAVESAQHGNVGSAAFQYYGFVTKHMHATLLAILGSAGFQAEDADDDMSPYLIRVVG
ncbi:hypothetical protein [Streptomyces sp. SID7909]|uniref:hypothetical protein n=1 Tax=Streptomyces sp. SID7909 TaxID=2706092 RepID=UPI0013B8632B|nr:hypothetical protein [Streptomyces sp. SID7909]NEC07004.1 hypothetical protein [Streptomyces sp. SID7909]